MASTNKYLVAVDFSEASIEAANRVGSHHSSSKLLQNCHNNADLSAAEEIRKGWR